MKQYTQKDLNLVRKFLSDFLYHSQINEPYATISMENIEAVQFEIPLTPEDIVYKDEDNMTTGTNDVKVLLQYLLEIEAGFIPKHNYEINSLTGEQSRAIVAALLEAYGIVEGE